MGRQERIARSVVRAIIGTHKRRSGLLASLWALFSTLFALYQLTLRRVRPADFANLRRNHWDISDDDYHRSFEKGEAADEPLKSIGDMGLSGSTFYSTADQKYLIKSLPRHAEYSFFAQELLTDYVEHMAAHPRCFLVRICDFLGASGASLGRLLRSAPSHHIIMENIMYGKHEAKQRGEEEWEHWDLKPLSYFYPGRDIADGALASEAAKDEIGDEFHDKVVLSREQAGEFLSTLEADTKFLAEHNAVDYSLFLVRMKADQSSTPDLSAEQTWRTGVASADGKYVFRAAILDFFWAKHKVHPRMMTLLIKLWNVLIRRSGPMSITTTPDEYRNRFLRLCRDIVEVRD
ncbi:hypothetical protein VTK26DRAFT_9032 [Humicola hyalothermophila]